MRISILGIMRMFLGMAVRRRGIAVVCVGDTDWGSVWDGVKEGCPLVTAPILVIGDRLGLSRGQVKDSS